MAVLASSLDTRSKTYLKNRQHALDRLSEMEELYAEAAQGGGKESVERLASRGKNGNSRTNCVGSRPRLAIPRD